MADYYNLYGYLNLFPGLSGFLYPVFQKNGTLYLADGDIHHIPFSSPALLNYLMLISQSRVEVLPDRPEQSGTVFPELY